MKARRCGNKRHQAERRVPGADTPSGASRGGRSGSSTPRRVPLTRLPWGPGALGPPFSFEDAKDSLDILIELGGQIKRRADRLPEAAGARAWCRIAVARSTSM